MAGEELYLDRTRAEIFGAIAEQYDRFRPTYPPSLIEDFAALRPSDVLDVGCGTGKVAADLARLGCSVLGVEPDPQMASVARSHGVEVEVSSFEDWDDAGRQFDLITFGTSWHWVDPARGVPKVAKVLRPGGTLARFWTYIELEADVLAALSAVYREHAPDAHAHGSAPDGSDFVDAVAESTAFSAVEVKTYSWDQVFSTDEWLGLVETYSDHQRLEPSQRAVLLDTLRTTIDGLGGSLDARGGVLLLLAQRVS